MATKKRVDSTVVDRLLESARRAAAGTEEAGSALIEADDRDIQRVLRRADEEERRGLLLLLAQLGKRGRRAIERTVARDGFRDDVLAELLQFLTDRHPDHPIVTTWSAFGQALDRADGPAVLAAFDALPSSLRRLWVANHGLARLVADGDASRRLMEERPTYAELLLGQLGPGADRAVLDRLKELADETTIRVLSRAIRTTFFRLRQRGVDVPELLGHDDAAPPQPMPPAPGVAYLSAVDQSGDQAIWIIEELEDGRHTVLQAVIDDRGAISAAEAMVLTRRGRDHLMEQLAGDRASPLGTIAVERAIGLLEEAYAANPSTAGSEYRGWRQLSRADRRTQRSPAPEFDEADRPRLAERSATLLEGDACRAWFLTRDEAERAEKRMTEETGSLVLPEAAERRRTAESIRRAAGEIWPASGRKRLANRLTASARYLAARDDDDGARLAAAAAAQLRADQETILPLMEKIIGRSIEALTKLREREADSKADEQSGLVSPGS